MKGIAEWPTTTIVIRVALALSSQCSRGLVATLVNGSDAGLAKQARSQKKVRPITNTIESGATPHAAALPAPIRMPLAKMAARRANVSKVKARSAHSGRIAR